MGTCDVLVVTCGMCECQWGMVWCAGVCQWGQWCAGVSTSGEMWCTGECQWGQWCASVSASGDSGVLV